MNISTISFVVGMAKNTKVKGTGEKHKNLLISDF